MLNLSTLKPKVHRKSRKRVGRGSGSGTGTYSGRGLKGQKARSGGNIRPGFEGGRMPMIRQFPKRKGFKSIHPKAQAVDVSALGRLGAAAKITPKLLAQKGLIADFRLPIKILGSGKLDKKLVIGEGIKISERARKAVEQAGGSVVQSKEKKQDKDV